MVSTLTGKQSFKACCTNYKVFCVGGLAEEFVVTANSATACCIYVEGGGTGCNRGPGPPLLRSSACSLISNRITVICIEMLLDEALLMVC